jgi:hypothetical protein
VAVAGGMTAKAEGERHRERDVESERHCGGGLGVAWLSHCAPRRVAIEKSCAGRHSRSEAMICDHCGRGRVTSLLVMCGKNEGVHLYGMANQTRKVKRGGRGRVEHP